ncbi:MAG: DEAD/DEAH box helicase, partial [Pseudomonadota bacterium]
MRRDDLRLRRLEAPAEALTVFVVDASGSAAMARLAEAKGAVEILLAEAYRRRDRVALVAFRGRGAELVLAPTREFATQIHDEILKLARGSSVRCLTVVGGSAIGDQGFILREGVEVIVGTPGRLNDCLDNQYLVLNQANYVVLDEADRMIDMGFEPQVNEVLEAMGGQLKSEDAEEARAQEEAAAQDPNLLLRTTAMFSATMPLAVQRLAGAYLRHPTHVQIGDEDSGKNKRIEQRILWSSEGAKLKTLIGLLQTLRSDDKVIVFVNAKKACDVLARNLERAHLMVGILHGGRSQAQREETLAAFREDEFQILVATDVAGRGLDISNVTQVFNYDLPAKIEPYSH